MEFSELGIWEIGHYKWGLPEIDLFATHINAKCKKYISWHRDPDMYAIDAFTTNWETFYFLLSLHFQWSQRLCKKKKKKLFLIRQKV